MNNELGNVEDTGFIMVFIHIVGRSTTLIGCKDSHCFTRMQTCKRKFDELKIKVFIGLQ